VAIDTLTRDFLRELDERAALTIAPTTTMAPSQGEHNQVYLFGLHLLEVRNPNG